MTDESLTARNRINQRNFRARRQHYIKELEERLRKYESEGVQATIEIQAAARQVTDQNNKLRSLLIQRFGMTDYEISSYLGIPPSQQQQSPVASHQNFPPILTSPAPGAPTRGLALKPLMSAETSLSWTTPTQRSDSSRPLPSPHLDPALCLANLHKFGPNSHSLSSPQEIGSTSFPFNYSTQHTSDVKSPSYDIKTPNSPTDTVSESSNPTTPAEQMQIDNDRPSQPQTHTSPLAQTHPTKVKSSASPEKTPVAVRRNDETSCEEAARIIASMRGGEESPNQVMFELGCTKAEAQCKVKNLKIFHLIDRD